MRMLPGRAKFIFTLGAIKLTFLLIGPGYKLSLAR